MSDSENFGGLARVRDFFAKKLALACSLVMPLVLFAKYRSWVVVAVVGGLAVDVWWLAERTLAVWLLSHPTPIE